MPSFLGRLLGQRPCRSTLALLGTRGQLPMPPPPVRPRRRLLRRTRAAPRSPQILEWVAQGLPAAPPVGLVEVGAPSGPRSELQRLRSLAPHRERVMPLRRDHHALLRHRLPVVGAYRRPFRPLRTQTGPGR